MTNPMEHRMKPAVVEVMRPGRPRMKNFLWSTWTRREITLLALSFALLAACWVTGLRWLDAASTVAFVGSAFCWGAAHVERKQAK